MATKKKAAKAAPAPAPEPAPPNAPNLYEVSGDGITVTYSSTGINGQPQLHYKDAKRDVTAVGDQIQSFDGPAGTRVGMVIQTVPDLKVIAFVLVLPRVNLPASNRSRIKTFGVVITSKTTIGGPALVPGQVDSYKTVELAGTAKFVLF